MAFPVPGSVAQMQSNMAATLNIDWIVDLARARPRACSATRSSARTALAALDARVLEAEAGAALLYHPYIHEAGERGPFVDANARAQFTGLSTRTGFVDLVRAVYEGLALAARDCYAAMGHAAGRGAARRRRRALARAARRILAQRAGRADPRRRARGERAPPARR